MFINHYFKKNISISLKLKPGFMGKPGCFRLERATQTTRIPTQMTTTVALTGTMISRSSQSGKLGKPLLVSRLLAPPPKGGARVTEKNKRTFSHIVVAASKDANDGDSDDDDGESRGDWHNQVEVGEEIHEARLELSFTGARPIAGHLSGRSKGSCRGADG